MTRHRRARLHGLAIAVLIAGAAAAGAGAPARADDAGVQRLEVGAQAVNVDLNVGALVIALGTLLAGLVGYWRLRAERPQIMAQIEALDAQRERDREDAEKTREERLQAALNAAWEEADRLRKLREEEQIELKGANVRLGAALTRITALEDEVEQLRARLAELGG